VLIGAAVIEISIRLRNHPAEKPLGAERTIGSDGVDSDPIV